MTTGTDSPAQMSSTSLFGAAAYIPPDPIFALTAEYDKDESVKKVNLGQGVYRDEYGNPWILPSVQKSRDKLAQQGLNHEYLPILGHDKFRLEATKLVLGNRLFNTLRSQVRNPMSLGH